MRSEHDGYVPCYELIDCTGSLEEHDLACESASLSTTNVYECEGYRLPTEAELEYATRAGTRTALYSGDITAQPGLASCAADTNLEAIAWYCHTSESEVTHPVARLLANQWGLFDVTGNAFEWTTDSGVGNPGPAPWTDPLGTLDLTVGQVLKGGNAWGSNATLRSAGRLVLMPNEFGPSGGLRLVRSLFD
ncbi:MAG TPA: SUMF1/EgtB/PvdO family nonheme iron enzyme [Polyangiaceae bacterium]|nr:SUMF1/EgtB/PvdO family nonheme iron enzyme [Polyangiaceae bacterium]